MSIEAMKLVIGAFDSLSPDHPARHTVLHINALRTAIQQADAKTDKPAAVRNPFAARCYTMSESHLSGHRLLVGFEKLEDAQAAHEWIARYGRCDYLHLGVEGIK